jgi:streptomycin 6-kinase
MNAFIPPGPEPLTLPPAFLRNIRNAFGDEGRRWLENLPCLLQAAATRWDLTLGEPLLLSYNYVCAAQRADGTEVVLKLGVPNRELLSELTALRLFNGEGCVRLLAADEAQYMFILERLRPGEMLVSLADDDQRTEIAAEVMSRLWRPAPPDLPFIPLSAWFGELSKLRPRFGGGTGPFPQTLVERVEALLPELFATSTPSCLIHGDFHHFNLLSSERGWLVIDPKGVVGPPEYECGPLLTNPIPDWPYLPEAAHRTARRIAILSERLDFPRERIRDWGLCHALLSAWWDMDENGQGGEYALACAEMLENVQL